MASIVNGIFIFGGSEGKVEVRMEMGDPETVIGINLEESPYT